MTPKDTQQKILRLNIGSGSIHKEGFINIDRQNAEMNIDVRQGLPFDTNSVDFIYCSHFIEHLNCDEAWSFLDESFRVLKRGGKIRLSTPDLRIFAAKYLARDSLFWDARRWPGKTLADQFNYVLRQMGHLYIYDFESLQSLLKSVGFTRIHEVPFDALLDNRPDVSIFAEAEKFPTDQNPNTPDYMDVMWAGKKFGLISEQPVRIELYEKVASICRGPDVLDLGCGDGALLSYLPDNLNKYGVDFSGVAIERARQRNIGHFEVGDICKLSYAPGTFDTVILMEVLEHIGDPDAVISEAVRVMKNGALLVITVPDGEDINDEKWPGGVSLHVSTWSEERLRSLVCKCGLSGTEVCRFGPNSVLVLTCYKHSVSVPHAKSQSCRIKPRECSGSTPTNDINSSHPWQSEQQEQFTQRPFTENSLVSMAGELARKAVKLLKDGQDSDAMDYLDVGVRLDPKSAEKQCERFVSFLDQSSLARTCSTARRSIADTINHRGGHLLLECAQACLDRQNTTTSELCGDSLQTMAPDNHPPSVHLSANSHMTIRTPDGSSVCLFDAVPQEVTNAKQLVKAYYQMRLKSIWGCSNHPVWFDHEIDYHLWPQNLFWVERGVFGRMWMKPGCRVLDLCSGDGYYSDVWYSTIAGSIDACDNDADALRFASLKHKNLKITYHNIDILTAAFPKAKYDVITWFEAVEHFSQENQSLMLAKIRSALSRNGILIGSTTLVRQFGNPTNRQHQREFTSQEDIATVFREAFSEVQTWVSIYPSRTTCYFSCAR